jgi:hypothetical protein
MLLLWTELEGERGHEVCWLVFMLMAVCFSVENNGWDKSGGAGQVTVELGQEALVGLVVAHDGWLWCGGEWLGQGRKNESEAFWGSGEMGLSFETINKIGLLVCFWLRKERLEKLVPMVVASRRQFKQR